MLSLDDTGKLSVVSYFNIICGRFHFQKLLPSFLSVSFLTFFSKEEFKWKRSFFILFYFFYLEEEDILAHLQGRDVSDSDEQTIEKGNFQLE